MCNKIIIQNTIWSITFIYVNTMIVNVTYFPFHTLVMVVPTNLHVRKISNDIIQLYSINQEAQ